MGRHQYLERLALGRSPFEDLEPEEAPTETNDENAPPNQQNGDVYQQQYDRKGRPVNPATEKQNQDLRDAQNAVLAVVGVVESKEQRTQLKYRQIAEARAGVLNHEQIRGDVLESTSVSVYEMVMLFPATLLARIQAGTVDFSTPFAQLLATELGKIITGGWGSILAVLFPGRVAQLLCYAVEWMIYDRIEDVRDRVDAAIGKRFRKPFHERAGGSDRQQSPQQKRAHVTAGICKEIACIAVDAILLPLKYYGWAQTLGLAPAWPLFPPWRALLPGGSTSIHNYLWTPLIPHPYIRHLVSPATLLLCWTFVNRHDQQHDPPAAQLTAYTHPHVNKIPQFPQDPFAHFWHTLTLFRRSAIHWLGYGIQRRWYGGTEVADHVELCLRQLEDNRPITEPNPTVREHRWRSTSLALLPPSYLAGCIDGFFRRLFLLPLENAMLRAITSSYLASSFPKTALITSAVANYLRPGGGFAGFGSWTADRNYMSKLGLGLALFCAAETSLFFALSGLVRWNGVRHFGWIDPAEFGKVGRMGNFQYRRTGPAEREEEGGGERAIIHHEDLVGLPGMRER
ncbi:hypothetical protein LTR09_011405 [Extremus antarcticus]|uniref:Uncharacterized protein n=1 Tax=Extremus antarcticus TaxID=702011 RepID=A0AAJ0DC29_9PEZI|nr:hypothetical protein LTR09_011405 [Extremus antarcticus]